MTIFYVLVFIVALAIELSTKCNTRNLVKKTGLAFIMIGALVHLSHKGNYCIEIGCFMMLCSELYKAYTASLDRRKTDHLPKRRKLLS